MPVRVPATAPAVVAGLLAACKPTANRPGTLVAEDEQQLGEAATMLDGYNGCQPAELDREAP